MITLKYFLSEVNIEPVSLLLFVSYAYYSIAVAVAKYDAICYQEYNDDPYVDCKYLAANLTAQTNVQQLSADWDLYGVLAYLVPGLISGMIFGAWGDLRGRKVNLLVGSLSLQVLLYLFLIYDAEPNTPLWLTLPFSFFAGMTGNIKLLVVSSYAYIADTTAVKTLKDMKMIAYSSLNQVAVLGAGLLAGILLADIKLRWVIVLAMVVNIIMVMYVLVFIHHVPPQILKAHTVNRAIKHYSGSNEVAIMKALEAQKSQLSNELAETAANSTLSQQRVSLMSMLKTSMTLQRDSIMCYAKRREGHRRAFILIYALSFFLFMTIELGLRGNLIALYVFKYGWNGSKLSYWRAAQGGVALIGNTIGLFVLKKMFMMSDTVLTLISLVSMFAEVTSVALVSYFPDQINLFMYGSAVLGIFESLSMPIMKIFVSGLVHTDEVGKVFTVFGIATDIGYILANTVFNRVYKATLSTFPSALFVLILGIVVVCFILVTWVHFQYKKEMRGRVEHFVKK